MSPNEMSFEDLVISISTELQSMDNTDFTKLLKQHRNGDVAQLILGSGALEANALEAESFDGDSVQIPSSPPGPMEISVQLPSLVLTGECIVSNAITAVNWTSIFEPDVIASDAEMLLDWTSATKSFVIFKSDSPYRASVSRWNNAFHSAPLPEPAYDVTGDEESLWVQAA